MENTQEYIRDLKEIRNIMERSSRFISLSGLSGILAGLFSLAGALWVYRILGQQLTLTGLSGMSGDMLLEVILTGLSVLILTLVFGIWLSYRKARQQKQPFAGPGSIQFLFSLLIPLVAGGLFVLAILFNDYYALIIPSCMIFYGIAIVMGSRHTISGIRWLGYSEILIALVCVVFPGYDLIFWSVGFGLVHLIYGIVMSIRIGL